jgi:hypothetical protein
LRGPWRWQQLLLNGTYATIEQLAEAEKINASYVSCVTRLAAMLDLVKNETFCINPRFLKPACESGHATRPI